MSDEQFSRASLGASRTSILDANAQDWWKNTTRAKEAVGSARSALAATRQGLGRADGQQTDYDVEHRVVAMHARGCDTKRQRAGPMDGIIPRPVD
ncbi:hypothetical protein MMC07_006671 [Pseudocyphellaria aurata]|nr:hypothetical protein [Pseudocyphellaria aurata]